MTTRLAIAQRPARHVSHAAQPPRREPGRTLARRKFFSTGALTPTERLQDAVGHRADRAGAEGDHEIVGARHGRDGGRDVVERLDQPHRYTRTRDLLPEFGTALGKADEIVLTDIYAAGEAPIPGATAEAVEAEVRRSGRPVRLVKALDELPAVVAAVARPNDLVITLGAGSIGTMPDRILEALNGS